MRPIFSSLHTGGRNIRLVAPLERLVLRPQVARYARNDTRKEIKIRIRQKAVIVLGVTGSEKLTQGGNMKLTHLAKWFLRCGGTDAEGGGSDGVGGVAQAWREYPGAGAGDGAFAEHGAALFARWRDGGTTQANGEAG